MRCCAALRRKARTREAFSLQLVVRSGWVPPSGHAAASSGSWKGAVRDTRFFEPCGA